MIIDNLINNINIISPNSLDNNRIMNWAYDMDLELYGKLGKEYGLSIPQRYELGKELWLEEGSIRIYELYVLGQMDYFNDDIERYNIRAKLFNYELENWMNKITRTKAYNT